MKILFSASTYPHEGSQFTAFIKVLCEEMTRQGHEVTVITPQSVSRIILRGEKFLPKEMEYDVITSNGQRKIKVLRPWTISFGYGRIGRQTLTWDRWFFERCLKGKMDKFDVVYAHFWRSGFKVARIAKKSGKKLIVATGEDVININRYLSQQEMIDLRDSTSGVVCVSTKNKNESIELGLTTEEKCVVLPNAADQSLFYVRNKKDCRAKLGFPQNKFIVAYCGRFNYRKGAKRVSDAVKEVADKDVNVIFIGKEVENQKVELDCPGILYKGVLPHEEIPEYIGSADVFVLPSLAEGCSNSIVEALSCGRPVISSDLPFNKDILDNSNSILIDPMDVGKLSFAIKKLKNDPDMLEMLSKGAEERANNLSITVRAQRILDFIKKLLKGNE